MHLYEGHQNDLKSRIIPATKTDMEDIPMKPVSKSGGATTQKKKRVLVAPIAPKKTTVKRAIKRPAKPSSTLQGGTQQQPRDRMGRFARKTGQILIGAAKGTVKAVKGTAKGVKSIHRSIKRVNASARRRQALDLRERKIAIMEREKRSGLKRKKIVRKRVRK